MIREAEVVEADVDAAAGGFSESSGSRYRSPLSNFTCHNVNDFQRKEVRVRTGGTLILTISEVYCLSYRQFPRTFPKVRRVRFKLSVTASFLH